MFLRLNSSGIRPILLAFFLGHFVGSGVVETGWTAERVVTEADVVDVVRFFYAHCFYGGEGSAHDYSLILHGSNLLGFK